MTATAPPSNDRLVELLTDHDILLAALPTTQLWEDVLAEPLGGATVRAVDLSPVGTGQVASCLRVRLDHDSPTAPRSVVVKTASSDPVSRSTSAALRHAEVEVGWYRNLAATAHVTCPHAWAAELSADASDFILVLDDIADAQQGDQIAGMSPHDVGRAVDELADLHASSWETVPAGTETWLVDRGDPHAHAVLLTMLHPGFVERYRHRLDPDVIHLSDELVAKADAYLAERPGPRSLVHGDFRPDNLLVGADAVHVVDWQTVTIGAVFGDLSYFLGGALVESDRLEHEPAMLERYQARLASHGLHVELADIEWGVRRYALDGLVMAIGASQVVGQTDRGDEMFCSMAERSAHHARSLDTLSLLT